MVANSGSRRSPLLRISDGEMSRAVSRRDPVYDGLFWFGVRTTGIFCRPTCPARPAKPENIEYFPGPAAALAAGYRPCKRCRPLDAGQQPPWVARLLAEVETDPARRIGDRELKARGLDPGTVRRHFRKSFGMTFQAYSRSRRLGGALSRLQDGGGLDDAIVASGYESESGFRAAFARAFGAGPVRAAQSDCIQVAWLPGPLGPFLAGARPAGLCFLEFAPTRDLPQRLQALARRHDAVLVPGSSAHLAQLVTELEEYFAGRRRHFTVPLDPAGTPFRQRVWQALQQIPYGETRSYADIAGAVGDPRAVRAVGSANGANPILILVPCHRVVNKNGKLGGYAGGLRRKEFLLELERSPGGYAVP